MGPRPGEPTAVLSGPRVLVLYRHQGWAIVAAQRTTSGRIHIEVGYCGDDPASVVVRKLVDVYTAWGPDAVVIGRGDAAEVVPELETAGIDVTVPNKTEEAQACGGFLSDALAGLLSHPGQDSMKTAVASAFKKELPSGGFIWEVFDPASYAQLMGGTLARWALVKFGVAPKRKTAAPRTAARKSHATQPTPTRRRRSEFDPMKAAF